ncbi:four-helix bundle copper-binding protein [Nitrosomonas sp. Nm51]
MRGLLYWFGKHDQELCQKCAEACRRCAEECRKNAL